MKTFIRAVEVWLPDSEHTLLEFGGGVYGEARRFGSASRSMCFGCGEGLPGQAWEAGRPIVLKQFEGSAFRRTQAAHAEGLTCGIALPVFAGTKLMAVLVIFCGESAGRVGPAAERIASGAGGLGRSLAGCVPVICEEAAAEPGAVGAGARAAGAGSLVALPVLRDARVAAVVAWYL